MPIISAVGVGAMVTDDESDERSEELEILSKPADEVVKVSYFADISA